MGSQVDPRHQQQRVVAVELGELRVAPVKVTHAGAVHQRDGAIRPLGVPKLTQHVLKYVQILMNSYLLRVYKTLGRCASFSYLDRFFFFFK